MSSRVGADCVAGGHSLREGSFPALKRFPKVIPGGALLPISALNRAWAITFQFFTFRCPSRAVATAFLYSLRSRFDSPATWQTLYFSAALKLFQVATTGYILSHSAKYGGRASAVRNTTTARLTAPSKTRRPGDFLKYLTLPPMSVTHPLQPSPILLTACPDCQSSSGRHASLFQKSSAESQIPLPRRSRSTGNRRCRWHPSFQDDVRPTMPALPTG
jgi:hypothetical protein